jgi:hypothetical protein
LCIGDAQQSNMGSSEPIKLLDNFESDQVYDFWLIQPKIILIYAANADGIGLTSYFGH